MKSFFDQLRTHLADNPPSLDGNQSVLAFLYEAYNQANPMDDAQIKADFDALYQTMNGMELREMDKILYPVCTLCRDHERAGFVEGLKVGIQLYQELSE